MPQKKPKTVVIPPSVVEELRAIVGHTEQDDFQVTMDCAIGALLALWDMQTAAHQQAILEAVKEIFTEENK